MSALQSVPIGVPFEVAGLVMDLGTLDGLTLQIDWGDGSPPEVTLVGSDGTFHAQHQFLSPGRFSVKLTAIDDDTRVSQSVRIQNLGIG